MGDTGISLVHPLYSTLFEIISAHKLDRVYSTQMIFDYMLLLIVLSNALPSTPLRSVLVKLQNGTPTIS